MKNLSLITLTIAVSLGGCYSKKGSTFVGGSDPLAQQEETGGGDEQGEGGEKKLTLTCSLAANKTYKGFGNIELTTGRAEEVPMQGDRYRVKPYSILEKEFTRVTGSAPKSLAANAASFSVPADRWYNEPKGSAVTLFTLYRVSYEAALNYVASDAKWAVAPSESTAKSECQLFARAAWNREPTELEIQACKQIAVFDTVSESDPKMRWAYALASVLNATGFIAY